MADGLNLAVLVGNLGADPELRMTSNGRAVMRMRLATSASYLDANRVRQNKTEWHTITVWGKRAEGLAKFLRKGDRLCVQGEIRTRSWEDTATGQQRYATEINATNVVLCGSKGANNNDRNNGDDYSGGYAGGSFDDDNTPGGDDDIPF